MARERPKWTVPTPWVNTDHLAQALRSHARGHRPAEAAVELLVRHANPWGSGWLDRADLRQSIAVGPSPTDPETLVAEVDWPAVRRAGLPGTVAERVVLTIASALADSRLNEALDAADALDPDRQALALRAIVHATSGPNAPPVTVHPYNVRTSGFDDIPEA